MKKNFTKNIALLLLVVGVGFSCSDKDEPNSQTDTTTTKVNNYIASVMNEVYFWNYTIDWGLINTNSLVTLTPQELFSKLKYTDDGWSKVTNDIQSFLGQVSGITTSFGYELALGSFSGTNVAIVLYTYKGSPAEQAGIKRGDFIVQINNTAITQSNVYDLFYASSLTIRKGILTENGMSLDPNTISMNAVTMYEDPVNTYQVIEKGGIKIGYLCYTGYVIQSESKLLEIFSDFKAQGVTDVILDLRYNGGGAVQTARLLSSILAPKSAVDNKEVMLTQKWNELYTEYWKQQGEDLNEYFVDTLDAGAYMDLSRLYVLTSNNTASASESTIMGLDGYLDLIQIGDTTHGKYYGGYIMQAQSWNESSKKWVNDATIENWGVYVMVYRFEGKNGLNNPSIGLVPDFYAEEDFTNLLPFGDEQDPLFSKALAHITGESMNIPEKAKSTAIRPYSLISLERKGKVGGMIETKNLLIVN